MIVFRKWYFTIFYAVEYNISQSSGVTLFAPVTYRFCASIFCRGTCIAPVPSTFWHHSGLSWPALVFIWRELAKIWYLCWFHSGLLWHSLASALVLTGRFWFDWASSGLFVATTSGIRVGRNGLVQAFWRSLGTRSSRLHVVGMVQLCTSTGY